MTDELMEDIYLTLMGQLIPEAEVPGVENAFARGGECLGLLEDIYSARDRVLDRLGIVGEDPDLEIMVSGYEEMLEIIGLNMFRLGYSWREE